MHKLAPEVRAGVDLPRIHVGDATADAVLAAGASRQLLLATRYTMEQDFYRGRLRERGIEARVPDEAGRTVVHDVIYDELCRGVVDDASRRAWVEIVEYEVEGGADGVIFGCTEVGLLLSPDDVPVPAFDTTLLHARAAIDFALG